MISRLYYVISQKPWGAIVPCLGLAMAGNFSAPTSAFAENITPPPITADETLSTTVRSADGLNMVIEGGERCCNRVGSGTMLFHSFDTFSVPRNGSAHFNNAENIQTVFSRVTGGTVSDIQGALSSNGTASLFLMNPAGIIFGEEASLNIGGSFFATTAEGIIFSDDTEFSAINPSPDLPLLTVNISPGLQMGQQSGAISIHGNGHSIIGGGLFPFWDQGTDSGLQMNAHQSLGFIAPTLDLRGGILNAAAGNIYLGGIAEGVLKLTPRQNSWAANSSGVNQFGPIHLSERSLVTTNGAPPGTIHLQGHNIELEDGSLVTVQNSGDQLGGHLQIESTGILHLSGSSRIAPDQHTMFGTIPGVATSRITHDSLGSAPPGHIFVASNNVLIDNGSSIQSRSYGDGSAGNLTIDVADSIYVEGTSPLAPNISSNIGSFTFSPGNAGNLDIATQNLSILDGAALASATLDEGRGGNIEVRAEQLVIDGFEPTGLSLSALSSATFSTGDSGAVRIDVARLSVINGGVISTGTLAEGDAGTLTVNATESIYVSDDIPDSQFVSGILSDATLVDQALKDQLRIPDSPSGNSGSVRINTPQLTIVNGGIVAVSNRGSGNSGRLEINADEVMVDRRGAITASSQSGQGGDINLNVNSLLALTNDSLITVEAGIAVTGSDNRIDGRSENSGVIHSAQIAQPQGNGGNITINAPFIVGLNNSDISANAFEGNGGSISIYAQGLFGLAFRDRFTPGNDITASSEFGLDGTVNISAFNVELGSGVIELPSDLTKSTSQVAQGCNLSENRFIVTGRGGLPTEPDIDRPWSQILPDLGSPLEIPPAPLSDQSDQLAVALSAPVPLLPEARRASSEPTSRWQEATMMAIAPNGNIQLTAANAYGSAIPSASCTSQADTL